MPRSDREPSWGGGREASRDDSTQPVNVRAAYDPTQEVGPCACGWLVDSQECRDVHTADEAVCFDENGERHVF